MIDSAKNNHVYTLCVSDVKVGFSLLSDGEMKDRWTGQFFAKVNLRNSTGIDVHNKQTNDTIDHSGQKLTTVKGLQNVKKPSMNKMPMNKKTNTDKSLKKKQDNIVDVLTRKSFK